MSAVDFWGADASDVRNKKLFLFDMDGTIYTEDRLFDGTLELLDRICANGGKYVFITNNSSRGMKDYIERVRGMGIRADAQNFFTSTDATVLYLKQKFGERCSVYCQGTVSMIRELEAAGIRTYTEVTDRAQAIVVGFDLELTSAKLCATCEMLSTYPDTTYIATNPDWACPVRFGFIPDCGSICQMLEHATGRKPFFIGKPEAAMIDIVREKFKAKRAETVVIGDRLYTDIASGLNAGVAAVCVLTGETTPEAILASDIKPAYTFVSVKEIAEVMR